MAALLEILNEQNYSLFGKIRESSIGTPPKKSLADIICRVTVLKETTTKDFLYFLSLGLLKKSKERCEQDNIWHVLGKVVASKQRRLVRSMGEHVSFVLI